MTDPVPLPESTPSTDREGAPARRGKLKVFFGAFPGVGKTYAMLAAGKRMLEAGRDVVIGVAETHGAPETEALAREIPSLGDAQRAGELDIEAILARKPGVVLVDKLAHDNPEGSRHPNRWNDVDELLASGIDVFTTMSVQELESLTDVVEDEVQKYRAEKAIEAVWKTQG